MLTLSPLLGCQSFHPFRAPKAPDAALARQWTQGGVEALHSGKLSQAKSFFSRAATQNPSDPIAHANLARSIEQDGNVQQAIEHMRRATHLARNDPRLIVELGEMYLQAGQWLPAKGQADLALEIDHRFAPAWVLQGKTNLAKGNLQTALADFQHAAGINANLPGLQLVIVETYQRMDQPLRALSAVEQLLSQYPPDHQPESALIAKSVALVKLRQLNPAIDLLQAASEREEATDQVFLRLSQAQLMAGQNSQARLTLTRAKLAFPQQTQFDSLLVELQSTTPHVASIDASTIR